MPTTMKKATIVGISVALNIFNKKGELKMKNLIKIFISIILVTYVTGCYFDYFKERRSQLSLLELELEETRWELEECEDKISDIKDCIDDLETAISDLRSEVDDFYYEDWRYNVPDVEEATSNVESAFRDLQSTAN